MMPSRFRDQLTEVCGGKLVITLDFEGHCLTMYTLPDWERVESTLLNMPTLNPATRRLQRMVLGYSAEVEMDSSGRIGVPPLLREKVNLDKKIMLVGLGKKFEIWSEDVWSQKFEDWIEEGPVTADQLPESVQTLVF